MKVKDRTSDEWYQVTDVGVIPRWEVIAALEAWPWVDGAPKDLTLKEFEGLFGEVVYLSDLYGFADVLTRDGGTVSGKRVWRIYPSGIEFLAKRLAERFAGVDR